MSRLVVLVWRIFLLKTMKYFRLNYFCIITFIFLGKISITHIYYCFVIIFFKSVKPCKQSTHFKQLTIQRFFSIKDFLKFFCQNFAIFEDFSKPMVLRNVEKSSNMGKFRKINEVISYIILLFHNFDFLFDRKCNSWLPVKPEEHSKKRGKKCNQLLLYRNKRFMLNEMLAKLIKIFH